MKDVLVLIEEMVETVNDNWHGAVEAYEKDNYLVLRSLTVKSSTDTEALEDSLACVIDGLRVDFDVDFDIEYMNGRTMVLAVLI